MDRLQSMSVFVQVAELCNFTQAAARLGISTVMVSRHIAALEKRLGVALFHRTTRRVSLTNEGAAYYRQCQRLLSEIDEAEASLRATGTRPGGTLRIDVNVTLATHLIVPRLPAFFERYPDIKVELHHTEHTFDVDYESFDLFVRLGPLADSNLVAKPLADFINITAAAPAYLKKHGEPQSPKDLLQHQCIDFYDQHGGRFIEFIFSRKGKRLSLKIDGCVACNQSISRIAAAAAGLGILQGASVYLAEALHAGKLQRILRDWETLIPRISLAYPKNRYVPAKVRAFVAFMQEMYPPGKKLDVEDIVQAVAQPH